MTTLVGTQRNFIDALKELIELDYDAVEAYEAAINRLERPDFRAKLNEFKNDHERHIAELSQVLMERGETPPTGPSAMKQWLAKGKVVIATLMGDNAIIGAMLTNEGDTNVAYERMVKHPRKWMSAESVLQCGLSDERRHRTWMEEVINNRA